VSAWSCDRCICPEEGHNGAGFCCNNACPCSYNYMAEQRRLRREAAGRAVRPALDEDEEEF
jgi:hypothetical protein